MTKTAEIDMAAQTRAHNDELRWWKGRGVDVSALIDVEMVATEPTETVRREACHRPLSASVAQYAELQLTSTAEEAGV